MPINSYRDNDLDQCEKNRSRSEEDIAPAIEVQETKAATKTDDAFLNTLPAIANQTNHDHKEFKSFNGLILRS